MTSGSNPLSNGQGATQTKAGSRGNMPLSSSSKISGNDTNKNVPQVNTPIKLQRQIGLMEAVSITVGSIIGSGIFVSPKGVLAGCGSIGMSLIIWVTSGILTMNGALCYAELGTSIPGSGGTYIYLKKAFGPMPAFLFLYTTILISAPCTMAILALTFANYVIFPFFANGCSLPESALRLIAATTLIKITFLNCYAVRGTLKVQNIFMMAKLSALCLVILFGLIHFLQGNVENFTQPFKDTITDPGSISIAFYSGFFSFGGWSTLNFMTEELKDPTKNLPKAIYISLPLVTVVYFLANAAYFAVISPSEIMMSSAIAVTFAEKLFGGMAWVIPLFVAFSTFGSLTIHIMSCSRLVYVAGRAGHCPVILSHLQASCLTPTPALVFLCIMSLIYLMTSDIYVLINYSSYVNSLANLGVIAGMLYMRKSEPYLKRPIKVSLFHPILYMITSIFAVILPIYVRPVEASLAIAITLTGLPVFHLVVTNKPGSWLVELNTVLATTSKSNKAHRKSSKPVSIFEMFGLDDEPINEFCTVKTNAPCNATYFQDYCDLSLCQILKDSKKGKKRSVCTCLNLNELSHIRFIWNLMLNPICREYHWRHVHDYNECLLACREYERIHFLNSILKNSFIRGLEIRAVGCSTDILDNVISNEVPKKSNSANNDQLKCFCYAYVQLRL